jgi:hypothetical protein
VWRGGASYICLKDYVLNIASSKSRIKSVATMRYFDVTCYIVCVSVRIKISVLLTSIPIFVPFLGSCLMHKSITVRVHLVYHTKVE